MISNRVQTKQITNPDKPWHEPGIEPHLKDMLDDPIIQSVMKRDGVKREDVEKLIDHVRARLIAEKSRMIMKAA